MMRIVGAVCVGLTVAGTASADATADRELLQKMAVLEAQVQLFKEQSELKEEELRQRIGSQEEHIKQLEAAKAVTDGRRLDAAAIASLGSAMDSTWLILCGALVMFMQAGFAMVESGCCRAKNVQNILMKNMVDVCVGTVCWYAFGWMIAYGGPLKDGTNSISNGNNFMGYEQYFGHEFSEADADGNFTTTSRPLNWFFQWAFCSAAATIVSGGVAERVNFHGYVIYSIFMTSFIYPVVVAWTWGYGWLSGGADNINEVGFMDFAGSGIVHMTGGVGALVGATVVGPRMGRFEDPDSFAPHSLPLVVLGTFILWFGWYGFNCGSTLAMSDKATGDMAAQVAMNTTLAASTGGITVLLLRLAMLRKYDIGGMCNGILAGLVSITAGCGNVESGSAVMIGILGALIYQGASSLLQKLKIDDPIDAFAVHGAAGAWGVLAAALFDWGTGFDKFNGWNGFSCTTGDDGSCASGVWVKGFAANIVEILMILIWVGGLSAAVFVPLRLTGLLRARDAIQSEGMDTAKHSPPKAYTLEGKALGA